MEKYYYIPGLTLGEEDIRLSRTVGEDALAVYQKIPFDPVRGFASWRQAEQSFGGG